MAPVAHFPSGSDGIGVAGAKEMTWHSAFCGAGFLLFLIQGLACGQDLQVADPPEFLPGTSVRGMLIYDVPVGGIELLHLPELTTQTIVPSADPGSSNPEGLHALAGPDENGLITYKTDNTESPLFAREYKLEATSVATKHDRLLTSTLGLKMLESLSLSPVGGKIAAVVARDGITVYAPPNSSAYYHEGELLIFDVQSGTSTTLNVKALDAGISWFRDLRRIAYVGRISPSELPNPLMVPPSGNYVGKGIAAIRILNLETRENLVVGAGRNPVLSPNGLDLYYTGADEQTMIATSPEWIPKQLQIPTDMYNVVLATNDRQVLGWGVPNEAAAARYTRHNSPLVGKKRMLTLRLGNTRTGESTIVLQYIDPRRQISGWLHDLR